jgi:hypothetical protein
VPPSLAPHASSSVTVGPAARRPPRRITYIDIQAHVRATYGFTPKTAWIAHVKESNGLAVRPTHNRQASSRVVSCPLDRQSAIAEALRYFGIL